MFFLVLPFFLAEILIFTTWTHFFDFWEVLPFYFLPSLLGAILVARSGQTLMAAAKTGVAPGQMPGNALLHQGAKVIGAICLIIPFFLPRVLAVILLLPGLRHMAVAFSKTYMKKKMAKGGSGFSFIRFGTGGAGGPFAGGFGGQGPFQRGPFGQGPFGGSGAFEEAREERDATVVDITPLEITHGPSKNGEPHKE